MIILQWAPGAGMILRGTFERAADLRPPAHPALRLSFHSLGGPTSCSPANTGDQSGVSVRFCPVPESTRKRRAPGNRVPETVKPPMTTSTSIYRQCRSPVLFKSTACLPNVRRAFPLVFLITYVSAAGSHATQDCLGHQPVQQPVGLGIRDVA